MKRDANTITTESPSYDYAPQHIMLLLFPLFIFQLIMDSQSVMK